MADLKAGHELDALIAVKVMGYVWQGNPRGNRTLHAPTGRQVGIKERGKPLMIFGSDTSPYLPAYSTDIAAAWEVVERLRGDCLHLLMNDTVGEYRAVFFTNADTLEWDRFSTIPTPTRWAWAATGPLAICLAALKAVEVPHV